MSVDRDADTLPGIGRQREPAPESARLRAAGWPAAFAALLTALGGVVATYESHQDGRDSLRAAYETLRLANAQRDAELAALRQSDLELRRWVEELSERLDKRQATAERVLRKVKPSAPIASPEPAPPAPLPPPLPNAAPVPPFDALRKP